MIIPMFQSHIVNAHSGSIGYSEVKLEGKSVKYDLYLLADLVGGLLNIDKNQDGYMKENELSQSKGDIEKLTKDYLSVINNGIKGEQKVQGIELTKRWNTEMFHIELEYHFTESIEEYEIDYFIFYNGIDNNHQNFMTISIGNKVIEHMITKNSNIIQGKAAFESANMKREDTASDNQNVGLEKNSTENDEDQLEIRTPQSSVAEHDSNTSKSSKEEGSILQDERLGFGDYAVLGMKHIWSGIDHLLFLFGLLLVKSTFREYIKMLTAFTVGHSITLALAALEIFIIPSSIIEPLIALSIVYVAAENIWAKSFKWRWLITLIFGFIHGFGFAEILIGKLGSNFIVPLLSFNLGVEIGQLVILMIMVPFIWMLTKIRWQTKVVYSISTLISFLGLYWFFDRVI